jgi:four helix bundle protein
MYTYSFEKLEVWIEGKRFTKHLYNLTSKFPYSEKYVLVPQLRRAAVSICSNIAEGSAILEHIDTAHFTTMAFSSAIEILNQLIISFELGFISEAEYQDSRLLLESITNKLNALRSYQIQQITK